MMMKPLQLMYYLYGILKEIIPWLEKISIFPFTGSSNGNCLAHHGLLPGDQSDYKGEKNRLMVKWPDPTSALRLALS